MHQRLRRHTSSLRTTEDLDPLMDRIGNSRIVMLGEASHGTSDFYTWRARLTQRLIQEKDFSFIAVEGDWPDCYRLNRFVKGLEGADNEALEAASQFERWPTWMWANWEVIALLDWMRRFNEDLSQDQKVGFFGLDVYSLRESLTAVLTFLRRVAPEDLDTAREAIRCFEPHGFTGQNYARATSMVGANCQEEVVELLSEIRAMMPHYESDADEKFNARQNAQVLVNAQRYYRIMIGGGPQSWNIRDRHMDQTLADLLDFHGPHARAIIWEHNTHIGDARFTDMASRGLVNMGQLGRQRFGEDEVVLVGFGTHRGHVIAGDSWGAPMQEMIVPPAVAESWEDAFHRTEKGDQLLIMNDIEDLEEFHIPRDHRAIGVVYHPNREAYGNYVTTILPKRYDAFIHIEESQAVHPLHIQPKLALEPETYPWGI